jgi:uncharacterized membrane protein YoaK (UPF0700 family)
MFQHKIYEQAEFKTYFDWLLLAFLAGYINAGGYLSCNRFVSHITGFATLAGIDLAHADFLEAFGAMVIPLFFLGGVMVSGFLTEKNITTEIKGLKYAPVMRYVCVMMAFVSVAGYFNFFGQFGEPAEFKHDFLLLALLCGACGLINGAISSASGATVRITHLTGLTTDLGLGLMRTYVHKPAEDQRRLERNANRVRVATIIAFTLGSTVGAVLFVKLKYLGFIPGSLLALYFWWAARHPTPSAT